MAHEKQKLSAPVWMGCPPEVETNDIETNFPKKATIISASTANVATPILAMVAISFLKIIL